MSAGYFQTYYGIKPARPEEAIKATGDAVEEAFAALDNLPPDEVRRQRREKYLAIGRSL